MGLLIVLLGFVLIGVCAGLASWSNDAGFDEEWQCPLAVGLSVFCGFSGMFCFIYGIVMMVSG